MKKPLFLSKQRLSHLVANQGDSGLLGNFLINQQLAILVGRIANEIVAHLVSHVRPQTASATIE
ncbi:hypothetical protein [Burkholderia cepacia]|uniref:hypothetical protein n=1 Tax=Burkholderia cepacia TaxID=292 RepID=UPI0012D924E0|nr:hypothetical protein [Burkholderia cepacia]